MSLIERRRMVENIDRKMDSPYKPMQVIFFNELAVSEQRIKNAMPMFG